jgi:putative transposase
VYHVLNRANVRLPIFETDHDYQTFEQILEEAVPRFAMRLLAYCLMPNHWHLLVWPVQDGDLSRFMRWVTLTHTQRWHACRGSSGTGHVYQGRFKSFPVQDDEHFYTVCRYVERSPLRANLVRRAEHWQWSSLWRMVAADRDARSVLARWPLPRPRNWVERVNRPQTEAELFALRHSLQRGSPYGEAAWTDRTVAELGLETTVRPRGRPRKFL